MVIRSQHPTPLPIPEWIRAVIRGLLGRAKGSSMPVVRKAGKMIPTREEAEVVPGALGRDEWDGAMRAWSLVEQRLGK